MRTEVIEKIYSLMKQDKNVYFLTGDLGFSVLEKIELEFPHRFINMGVAEQNMMGTAAGLALNGKKVFVYSIIPFATMRCFEQIRDDICYNDANVTIIGVGSGLSYGILGSTHFALEDIAILRCLPNMTIVSPADGIEATLAIDAIYSLSKPCYLRIGKKEEPKVYRKSYLFELGKGVVLSKGNDITIFSTGTILKNVLDAGEILKEKYHISSSIVNIHTIKPLDTKLVVQESKGKRNIFTVEEHSQIGGLGSAIAEIVSGYDTMPSLTRIGTPDRFIKDIGSQKYLRDRLSLSPMGIAETIHEKLIK